jgi:hypothetical protein
VACALDVQQHSGGWAMAGKVPVGRVRALEGRPAAIGRMNAIQLVKTMAGSPDADAAFKARSASRHLAHGFPGCRVRAFREPMKEPRNVP